MSESSGTGGEAGLDTSIPNVARVYDYMLGGKDNYAADRELGDQLQAAFPESAWIAQQNRAFMGRAVQFCAEQGINQFLDVGSGLPTMGNVHEVVRNTIPDAAVVYVDNDRVALAHANALLATSDGVAAILGDVREPGKILADATGPGLLDLSRPFAVVLAAIFHFITDDEDPQGITRVFTDAMPSGSYLILSTATHDIQPEASARARDMYRNASSPLVTRTRDEIAALFTGLELVEPGLVPTSLWRPQAPVRSGKTSDLLAAVGRKP